MRDVASDGAVPVPAEETAALYRDVVSLQGSEARKNRRAARRAIGLATGLFGLALVEGVALAAMLPLKSYVPVFVYMGTDGVTQTAQSFSTLPPTMQVAGIEALLWQYVRNREHYSYSESETSYAVVSAMSNGHVRQQYQDWMDPKNPDSPVARLGTRGFIRVARISSAFPEHADDYTSGRYTIRFTRTVHEDGRSDATVTMIVSFSYVTAATIPLAQRLNFNPGGIVITEYPGPEVEGAPSK